VETLNVILRGVPTSSRFASCDHHAVALEDAVGGWWGFNVSSQNLLGLEWEERIYPQNAALLRGAFMPSSRDCQYIASSKEKHENGRRRRQRRRSCRNINEEKSSACPMWTTKQRNRRPISM